MNLPNSIAAAPVSKMAACCLLAFVFCDFLKTTTTIDKTTILIAALALAAAGIAAKLTRHSSAGFYLLAIAMGAGLLATTNNRFVGVEHATAPPQTAIIRGKVTQTLKPTAAGHSRAIVEGTIDAKHLPKLLNTKVLLTVIGRKTLSLGDSLLAAGSISPPAPPVLPGDFDECRYLRSYSASVKGIAVAAKTTVFPHRPGAEDAFRMAAGSIERKIDALFSGRTADFVKAILLADKTDLDPAVKRDFQLAGVAHILAVSGFHLGVISAIVWLLLSFLPLGRWPKLFLFAGAVVAFGLLTGLQPPVIRAGCMAIWFLLGKTMQRQTDWLAAIAIVLLGTLVFAPELLYSVSFQLSMLSVVGIFLCYGVFRRFLDSVFGGVVDGSNLSSVADYLKGSAALTLSASVVIMPLVVYYFGMFSLVAPLVNIIIIPLFAAALVFAVLAIGLGFVCWPLASIYAYNVELLTDWCHAVAGFAASFRYSAIATSSVGLVVAGVVLLLYCVLSAGRRQLLFRGLVVLLCGMLLFLLFSVDGDSVGVRLYVKRDYSVLDIPLSSGGRFVWLADNRPNTKYYRDAGLVEYFRDSSIRYVGINGAFGRAFVEANLTLGCGVSVRRLGFAEQRALEHRYLAGEYISQAKVRGLR